jgi:hypothetical protein
MLVWNFELIGRNLLLAATLIPKEAIAFIGWHKFYLLAMKLPLWSNLS